MIKLIKGNIIYLRPATLQDREKIFNWLTNSNLTTEMMGPSNYPDSKIPTWDEFISDYQDYYFNGLQPLKGQCYVIVKDRVDIGQINYNEINQLDKSVDLDIWLSDKIHTGKGYGTEAIKLLCDFLNRTFGCQKIILSPSQRNTRAIRAYEKAGFTMTDEIPERFEMDYEDNVILVKTFDK